MGGHRWGRPCGLRGKKVIILAAGRGRVGAVRHLLRMDPGAAAATNGAGDTALHVAAVNGRAEVGRVLLAAGAALDARDDSGLLAEDVSVETSCQRT